ncbi:MAG: DUF58 domain-containing protein [bacterium]
MKTVARIRSYGRLFFLAGWIFLLFLIATNIQSGWLYVIISFLALLGFLSALLPGFALRSISVAASQPELCERGAPQAAILFLENRSRFAQYTIRVELPAGSGLEFDPPNLLAVRIPGRSSVAIPARFVPMRRGELRIGHVTLVCSGPTGLFAKKRVAAVASSSLVYPKLSDADGESLAGAAGADNSSPVNRHLVTEDPYHYALREYVPGDSLRRIHWKLTAKRNEPIMRINESKTFGVAGILVDNLRDHYPPPDGGEKFELLLEKAASLARHLLFSSGMSVTLYATASPEIELDTHEVWERALRWLALIRLEDAPAGGDCLAIRAPEFIEYTFSPNTEANT